MADHVLDLVRDTTVVINLSYGGLHGIRGGYVPTAPEPQVEFWPSQKDGSEVAASRWEDVTESVVILFKAATNDLARAAINTVEGLLKEARAYAEFGEGSPIYIHYKPGNTGTTYRSQVLSGTIQPSDEAITWQWKSCVIEAQITWTRRYFWESTVLTTLVNGGRIFNHGDAGGGGTHINYVEIAGASVLGAIPSPAQISIKHITNDGGLISKIWIGRELKGSSWMGLFREAEDDVANGSTVVDASSSGGNFRRVGLAANELVLFAWTWSTLWAQGRGRYFNIIGRFANALAAGVKIRWQVRYSSTILWQGDLISLTTDRMQSLGAVPIPPGMVGSSSSANLTLYLMGLGSGNFDLDYLQLIPGPTMRTLVSRGVALAVNESAVDDPAIRGAYMTTSGGSKVPAWYALHDHVLLWPGVDQRIYVTYMDNTGALVDRTADIYVYHRPRRLTL